MTLGFLGEVRPKSGHLQPASHPNSADPHCDKAGQAASAQSLNAQDHSRQPGACEAVVVLVGPAWSLRSWPSCPSTPCMVAHLQPQLLYPLTGLEAAGQPQALNKPECSQVTAWGPTPPNTRHTHSTPKPFGPLIETGAPCSEAVLLGSVIKRQEDIRAQALEWDRLQL